MVSAGETEWLEDKQSIVEGLSRVTALLPAKEAAAAGQRLIAPFLQAAQACLDAGSGTFAHQKAEPYCNTWQY